MSAVPENRSSVGTMRSESEYRTGWTSRGSRSTGGGSGRSGAFCAAAGGAAGAGDCFGAAAQPVTMHSRAAGDRIEGCMRRGTVREFLRTRGRRIPGPEVACSRTGARSALSTVAGRWLHRRPRGGSMFRSLCAAAAACAGFAACVRNPATGNLQLNLVSESQEIELGKQASQQVEQSIGLYKDQKLEAYVSTLGQSLAQQTNRKNLPWQFHVVEDAAANAFALPGGPPDVTRGILATLMTQAQLPGVMGHEWGHIAARHSANQISKAELAQVGLGLGSVLSPQLASLSQIASAGLQVLFLKFSRDDENQADKLGFAYMANDGYDPRQMVDVFKTLERVSKLAGGGKLPEWLQTHPDPGNREKAAEERLKEVKADFTKAKVRRDEYLGMIDGLVYGEDPRQGYFQGARFLHPDLKFQVTFPQGWQTQNTPQAVAGMSPKQDAIVELAAAGKMTPEEAAQKVFSQKGVQQGQAAQLTVNGQHAVASYFAGQTQQGEVAGLVAFVSYNGSTYALLGYTGAPTMPQYDPIFKAFIGSFGPLTDPGALSVQHAKIQIVRVDRDMTVEQFNQLLPSNVKLEELALINGLDDKNGRLQAGQKYKRVVGGPPVQDKPPAGQQPKS